MWWKKEASPGLLEKAPMCELSSSSELMAEARTLLGYGASAAFSADVEREVQKKLDEFGYDFLVSKKVIEYQLTKTPLHRNRELYWSTVPIANVVDAIPAFALSKAVQLKKAFPSAEFFCDVCERDPDPFLVMVYKQCTFYVEVWDEPEFEGRQVIADTKRSTK